MIWRAGRWQRSARRRPMPTSRIRTWRRCLRSRSRSILAQRTQIANALIADRANAHYAAAQAPLPVAPPRGGAQPALFGAPVPPAPPVDPDASSASLPGASAPARPVSAAPPSVPFGKTPPPAPATPPSRAPRTAVSSAPLAAPPPQTAAAEAAAAPTIPDAPPPAPVLPGVDIPVTVPTPKLVAPTPATKPGFERLSVPVAFAPGSAIVPPESKAPLIALVKKFGGATAIAVTGFGDSTSTSPQAQDAAVRLALLRAHAIADVYTGFGVPTAKLRLDAQAAGSGGEAHLTD